MKKAWWRDGEGRTWAGLDLRGMDGVGRVFGPQKDGQTYAAAGYRVGGQASTPTRVVGGGVCGGVMGLATERRSRNS